MLGLNHINISQSLLHSVARVDEFKGLWRGLDKHTTSLKMLSDVAEFGSVFTPLLEQLKDQTINTTILSKLHKAISGIQNGGAFKTTETHLAIRDGEEIIGALETASPEDVPALTTKLLGWIDTELSKNDLHPIISIAVFSAVFLQICPYERRNQKLMQFLITMYMLKSGYAYAGYVPLAGIINDRAREYHDRLKNLQDSLERGTPDWAPWLAFFTAILHEQTQVLERKINADKKDFSNLPTLSGRVMNLFDRHERLQMKQIIKLTNGRRSTLKLRLQELIDDGYLVRHGQARSTWYSLV